MRRKRGQIELFSMSLLDVLANALGGMLILLLLTMDREAQESAAASTRSQELQNQVATANKHLNRARRALDESQGERGKLAQVQDELRQMQAALVGVKGEFKRVVFLFDTSGSMDTPHFSAYKEFLRNWILNLPFEQFTVLEFNTQVNAWTSHELKPANDLNRREAVQFIDGFQAGGATNTLAAFQAAFAYPAVDSMVLFSDGAPTKFAGGEPLIQNGAPVFDFAEILAWLDVHNADRHVAINTVGMGQYFDNTEGWGKFLHDVAERNGGIFLGR